MPIAAFYRAMSERAGLSMEEMLARYPLPEVRGDIPQGAVEKQVDDLTRLLAVARKQGAVSGKADGRQTLLEFIDALGGINDVGGELKARNAVEVKRGRGKKTLRLARERGQGGRGADEIARAVVEAGYLADQPAVQDYLNALREGRVEPDIVAALWEAIDAELRGQAQYVMAEMELPSGLVEQIADLEQYLAGLGLNLEDSDADIRAAIERGLIRFIYLTWLIRLMLQARR